jgi:hypothetical protein
MPVCTRSLAPWPAAPELKPDDCMTARVPRWKPS